MLFIRKATRKFDQWKQAFLYFQSFPTLTTFIPLMTSNTVENAKYKLLMVFLLIIDIILFKVFLSR